MAKSETEAENTADTSITLTLDEFCTRLSESVRRPELLGAFHSVELGAQRLRDTFEAFKARFDAFMNQPA